MDDGRDGSTLEGDRAGKSEDESEDVGEDENEDESEKQSQDRNGSDPRVDIDGYPTEQAVDAVVDADESATESATESDVETILRSVADDGEVTLASVEDALAHASKVVATPETRVELAEREFESAREAASEVDDLAVVTARLAEYESRLESITERATALGPRLQSLVDSADDADRIYEVAAGIRRLEADANEVQTAADDLMLELEDFETWLRTAAVRERQLEGDLEALDEALDAIDDRLDGLASVADRSNQSTAAPAPSDDPADEWALLSLRVRMLELMLADVETELDDLRRWATRENLDHDGRLSSFEDRLADVAERQQRLASRLESLDSGEWHSQHGDLIAAFETDLDQFDPPVSWRAVHESFESRTEPLLSDR